MKIAKLKRFQLMRRFRPKFAAAVRFEVVDHSSLRTELTNKIRDMAFSIYLTCEKGPEASLDITTRSPVVIDDDKIPEGMLVWPKDIKWPGEDVKISLGNSEVIELPVSFDYKIPNT